MNRPTDTPNAAARTTPAPDAAVTPRALLGSLIVFGALLAFLTAPLATVAVVAAAGLWLLTGDTARRLRGPRARRSSDGGQRSAEPTAD